MTDTRTHDLAGCRYRQDMHGVAACTDHCPCSCHLPRLTPGTVATVRDTCVWPERRGLTAVVVDTTGCDVYPVHGLGPNEVIVFIPDDPQSSARLDGNGEPWSCVIHLADLEVTPMTAVSKRTVTTTRHEYVVPSPACVTDVREAIEWALRDMPDHRRYYDDACTVEARDDEIVVWWPEQAAKGEP